MTVCVVSKPDVGPVTVWVVSKPDVGPVTVWVVSKPDVGSVTVWVVSKPVKEVCLKHLPGEVSAAPGRVCTEIKAHLDRDV